MKILNMPEAFLHYVWQVRQFDMQGLTTTDGVPVHITHPGTHNHHQGPDFLQADIQIGSIRFVGQVEIHLQTKDWYTHRHQLDRMYDNTILHVVGKSTGQKVYRQDGSPIPEVSIEGRIPQRLMHQYQRLLLEQEKIACHFGIHEVRSVIRDCWIERLAIERVVHKALRMRKRLSDHVQDWQQVLWEETASMVGGTVNQDAFRAMATAIPYRIIAKEIDNLGHVEALLFGGCGFLQGKGYRDKYYQKLKCDWNYLKDKYKLASQMIPLKFMRMRPASFPTLRISQLAAILTKTNPLISLIELADMKSLLEAKIVASSYWKDHYRFFEKTKRSTVKQLGRKQKETLLINTIIPLGYLYLQAHGRKDMSEIVEAQLSYLSAENNNIIRAFEKLDLPNPNALYSQGLIQLKKYYCDRKKCLQCAIGHQILGKDQMSLKQ